MAGREMMDGKPVWVVDATFPEGEGFYARQIRIAFCAVLEMPVMISIFDWHNLLSEEYVFHHLNLDVGLTEDDFDPRNPAYHFQGSRGRWK